MKKNKFSSFLMLAVAAILSIAVQGCSYYEYKTDAWGNTQIVEVRR